jgi:hypothetical protein
VAALVGSGPLPAAQPGSVCTAPAYHAFDFWVGDWRVTGPGGELAGHNTIAREQDGCLLLERWEGVQGSTGVSMNYYDPVADAWRQVWVSPGAEIDIAGNLEGGSMVLEGTITYLADERRRGFRGTWTPLDDGRVRQHFEEQDDAGAWREWFDGYYARVAEEVARP